MLSLNEVRLSLARYLIGCKRAISVDLTYGGEVVSLSSDVPAQPGRSVDFWRVMQEIGAIVHRARDGITCVVALGDMAGDAPAPEFTFVPGGAFFPGRNPVHDGLLDIPSGVVPRLTISRMRPGVRLTDPVLALLVSGPGDFEWRKPGDHFLTKGARIGPVLYFQNTPAEEIGPDTTCQVYGVSVA